MEEMKTNQPTVAELLAEIQTLRDRLATSEETLRSIQQGEVDALVVSTPNGPRIFTLQSADQSYRLLVEEMQQGAVILSDEGLVLYCNRSLATLVKQPLEQLIGSHFHQFLSLNDTPLFQARMQAAAKGDRNVMELFLIASNATEVPVYLSINTLNLNDVSVNCVVITDLTEQKQHESTLASEKMERLMLEQTKEQLEARVAERTSELSLRNAELQQSESILRSFFNSGAMPMGIVELHDNDILHISDNWAAAQFFGTTQEAMRQQYASLLGVPPEIIQQWSAYYRQAEQTQMPVRFEYLHTLGTQQFWLSGSVCPIATNHSGYPRFSYIVEDVTDRKQAEETLAHREEQLRLTLDFTHIGTWDWNVKTNDVSWNDNHFHLMGLEPQTTTDLYQCWRNLIHPDDVEWVEQALLGALAQHTNYEAEYRVIHPDGTLRWLVGKGHGIYDNAGEPIRMLGVILDVSDRKSIEEALQTSEERYRAIIQDQTELIIRYAPDSTVLFVNDAYCRYFGFEPDDALGKSYNPVIYEADRERVAQLVRTMNVENPTLMIENRVIDAQGGVRWTQWVNRMLFDPQGKMLEYQAVGRDITELKQAEQALRNSEERLQLALEASGDGIWDWDISTNEIYYSPQYFQMLGYAAEELPQSVSTWYQLVHPEDMIWVSHLLSNHLKDSSVRYEFDYRLRTKDDSWKWVADYGKVVARDQQGRPLRMIGTHRDASDRKQTEEHIAASLREKEVLLKEIHHRVKNNLGIVSSLLQMQIRRTHDPQATVILQDSQNRIASIALVHEKLYRSKDLAQIDCTQYIQDLTIYLFDSYNTSANQIKLIVEVENGHLDIETVIPCGLIINELVSNALKHAFPGNRKGEIRVRFSQSSETSEAPGQERSTLVIQDNGIGLPQNFDIQTTKTLGLTLVQGLAKQIGATIEIKSQQGTEFTLTFSQLNL
ncbi:MAG: PAS domain S-box protein [Oscillatoriophycideae cyanobacterium NC_groundwater_1537_Pr4_S-0.65um_50_18]|nr:PAS domain S-box protein [Oscillatoriophycideae cyanobacterium NC_groundwater_1537_Pr4_S-0.65um_50_18]